MAMRVAINDPARVVGVTSQITTARDPGAIVSAPVGRRRVDGGLLGLYQRLDFIRAFLNNNYFGMAVFIGIALDYLFR